MLRDLLVDYLGGNTRISWSFPGKIMLMETPILGSEPLKGTRHPFVLHLVMNDPELCPITAPREVTGLDTRSSLTFPLGVIYEKG